MHACGVALAVRDPFPLSLDQLEMRFGYIKKTTLKCITDGNNKRKSHASKNSLSMFQMPTPTPGCVTDPMYIGAQINSLTVPSYAH